MATRTRQQSSFVNLDEFVACVAEARAYLQNQESGSAASRLGGLHKAMAHATQRALSRKEFLDEYAQAVACGRIASGPANGRDQESGSLLADVASPLVAESLADGLSAWPPADRGANLSCIASDAAHLAGLYEPFLGQQRQQRRSRNGVYYTPRELAGYVVRQVDSLLQAEFGLQDGLADVATWSQVIDRHPHLSVPVGARADEPFVRILDPAVGGGVFLAAAIESIHQTMQRKWRSLQWAQDRMLAAWQDYVPRHLLPRLCGLEVMLPAAVVAHWQVFQTLVRTGYRFQGHEQIRLFVVDTLGDWSDGNRPPHAATGTADSAHAACRQEPFAVVLGNPPFSGISRNNGRWITDLLRGRSGDGRETASYYRANGEPLAERKHWLQDDYVKFLRYAQWRIETTGAGIIGFVTNHGYLDNVTFRGMREQLRTAFSRITVLDLHGSAKKKERAPDGQPDENVFGIESGIAVGLLRKPLEPLEPSVEFGELWGTRAHKLASLARHGPPPRRVTPMAPYHLFTPCLNETAGEYDRGIPLTDIMPVNSTVAVTARDRFVVEFERDELLRRMAIFRDLVVPDDQIRARFFSNSRSPRYPAGDTRGWKLTAARQRMANDPNWQRHVRPCLYRPFDQRWIYWTEWMVDWPRTEVNQHLIAGDNLALITRRQMLPTQACNFFWVSRLIPIDGVIRSDNRGSESAFPLFLTNPRAGSQQGGGQQGGGQQAGTPNFSARFIASMERALQLEWQAASTITGQGAFGPLEMFYYIYAQFHSAEYRRRYADWIRIDFPRVFVPRNAALFRQLSQLGAILVNAHSGTDAGGQMPASPTPAGRCFEPGYPQFDADRIQLHDQLAIDQVALDVWEFCAGGHQVCRKWWRDRRGRALTAEDVANYRALVNGVRTTLNSSPQIDRCIEAHGGWPNAFIQA